MVITSLVSYWIGLNIPDSYIIYFVSFIDKITD
jgi:hypothetical protein